MNSYNLKVYLHVQLEWFINHADEKGKHVLWMDCAVWIYWSEEVMPMSNEL